LSVTRVTPAIRSRRERSYFGEPDEKIALLQPTAAPIAGHPDTEVTAIYLCFRIQDAIETGNFSGTPVESL
jgi:hypothetical protein